MHWAQTTSRKAFAACVVKHLPDTKADATKMPAPASNKEWLKPIPTKNGLSQLPPDSHDAMARNSTPFGATKPGRRGPG
eukprot:6794174-Prorocentrum_lima.AAC.1